MDPHIVVRMGLALGMITPGKPYNLGEVIEAIDALPRGAIVCTTELTRCEKMWNGANAGIPGAVCISMPNQYWSPNWQTETDEYLFGDWTPGRFAWDLENVKTLDTPVAAKGRQGLWDWEGRV